MTWQGRVWRGFVRKRVLRRRSAKDSVEGRKQKSSFLGEGDARTSHIIHGSLSPKPRLVESQQLFSFLPSRARAKTPTTPLSAGLDRAPDRFCWALESARSDPVCKDQIAASRVVCRRPSLKDRAFLGDAFRRCVKQANMGTSPTEYMSVKQLVSGAKRETAESRQKQSNELRVTSFRTPKRRSSLALARENDGKREIL